jgi:hypothetical protein
MVTGLAVVAAAVVFSVSLAGLSFANGGPAPSTAEYQYGEVTICHHTHGRNGGVTIRVDANALRAHLAHGDTIGPC